MGSSLKYVPRYTIGPGYKRHHLAEQGGECPVGVKLACFDPLVAFRYPTSELPNCKRTLAVGVVDAIGPSRRLTDNHF